MRLFSESIDLFVSSHHLLRTCVPLTQLVELNFCGLLDSTLSKVVIGYITLEFCQKLRVFGNYNEFFDENSEFFDKNNMYFDEYDNLNSHITEVTIKIIIYRPNLLYNDFNPCFCVSRVILVTYELNLLLDSIRPYQNKSCFAGPYHLLHPSLSLRLFFPSIPLKRDPRSVIQSNSNDVDNLPSVSGIFRDSYFVKVQRNLS